MRRSLPVLVAVLVVVLGLAVFMRRNAQNKTVPEGTPPAARGEEMPPVAVAAPGESAPHFVVPMPDGRSDGGGAHREARAYRLVLDGAHCTLEAVEEIRGDFRKPRAVARAAGMLNCRLLDAAGRLLAEEILPAPDHACVVLDPETPDADGRPTPAAFTAKGPVTFQTRLPAVPGAARLEVIRLSGVPAALAGGRPPGRLLASIPLAAR